MDSELTDYYYQLEQENDKLKQKISKLEKNGLRMIDARLETLEEEMKIVWHILDKVENIEKKVSDIEIYTKRMG